MILSTLKNLDNLLESMIFYKQSLYPHKIAVRFAYSKNKNDFSRDISILDI